MHGHSWMHHHAIKREEMSVVDRANRCTKLLLKEALSIQLTSVGERLNQGRWSGVPQVLGDNHQSCGVQARAKVCTAVIVMQNDF